MEELVQTTMLANDIKICISKGVYAVKSFTDLTTTEKHYAVECIINGIKTQFKK